MDPLLIGLVLTLIIAAELLRRAHKKNFSLRGQILDKLEQGIILLDSRSRVVEFNHQAGILFPDLVRKHWLRSGPHLIPKLFEFLNKDVKARAQYFTLVDGDKLRSYMVSDHPLQPMAGKSWRALVLKDCTRELELHRELEQTAQKDPDTDVWNRRYWTEQSRFEFSRAGRYRRPLTLLVFTLGNPGSPPLADRMLKNAAGYLDQELRSTDLLGRLDSHRFAVLLPETPQEAGEALGQRLLSGLNGLLDQEVPPSVLEVSGWDGEGHQTLEGLMAQVQPRN